MEERGELGIAPIAIGETELVGHGQGQLHDGAAVSAGVAVVCLDDVTEEKRGAPVRVAELQLVVDQNEPFYIAGAGHSRSLYLPSGSTAYSPPACFGLGHWNLRFFAVNTGSRNSTLRVSVVVMHLLGALSILDGGTVSHTGVWQPSPKIGLLVSNRTSLLGGRSISFRFTPTGSGAAWRIDDVYVDPWKGT